MSGRHGRRSENDTLIEMRRLRAELSGVRAEMERYDDRQRSSSFRTGPVSARKLRNRAGIAMLTGLALLVGLFCWLLYELLASTMGRIFDGLLPHPVEVTVNTVARIMALLF